ncbi:hypothetical protein [Ornithinibacillus halotolerans]|uniref:Uncharacterized protein n=1 Tax=Ornithinibacillus halotolerans TaxID=1274357 RepID=A0A916RTW5_9BACI|nr:hypothetical protein [Ornithinibacillus halotolerans]GGA69497.1 hypothetical protein GCM10008025_11810 [Ornithinibacillus halotolerans]
MLQSFSMWQLNDIDNLDDAIVLIRDMAPIVTNVEWDDEPLVAHFNSIDGFDLNVPETIEIGNNNIRYVTFEFYTERSRRPEFWFNAEGNMKPRDERVNTYNSQILLFEHNNSVKSIVFKGTSLAKTILNTCMPEETWGAVEPAEINVSEDLLYWIFRKFIDLRESPLSPNNPLYVTALKSYTGKTRDNVNAMRGRGNRISTILGTLAFLFNNENLKAVRPQLQYNGEVFLVEISLTGTCRIWEEEYQGRWLALDSKRLKNNIAIYTYIVLLPILVESYRDNVNRGVWSPQLKIEFLQRLGNEIKDQVEAELERLQNEANIEDEEINDEEEHLTLFDILEEDDE